MIATVGKRYSYRVINLCFHFARENSYSPWKVIGILASYGNDAQCNYMFEYKHIKKEFHKECDNAGSLCGKREFLENWRKQHVELHSVISPIISYCSSTKNKFKGVAAFIKALSQEYLGLIDPYQLWRIAVMLKSQPRYYPLVFDYTDYRKEEYEFLRSVGEIKYRDS